LLISLLRKANTVVIAVLGASIILSGCAANIASSTTAPNVNLREFNTFYVIHSEADSRGVHRAIQGELMSMGKKAESGPGSSIPDGVDVVVTYHASWVLDNGWYLRDLLIQLRDPKTNVLLASSLSSRPSLEWTLPVLMAREVLDSMLK